MRKRLILAPLFAATDHANAAASITDTRLASAQDFAARVSGRSRPAR